MKPPETVTFHVRLTIRLNYRPFGDSYDPALAVASVFTRRRLAEHLKRYFENLVPGFLFEVHIEATRYGPGDGEVN